MAARGAVALALHFSAACMMARRSPESDARSRRPMPIAAARRRTARIAPSSVACGSARRSPSQETLAFPSTKASSASRDSPPRPRSATASGSRRRSCAVGVFGSGALTNEKTYLLGKFARVALGTANIDYNGRFCMSSAAAASLRAFGLDRGLPFPLEDIAQADAVLLVGGNAAETMPPFMQYLEEQRAKGGRLIVVDPVRSPTAQAATLHLQI